MKKVKIKIIDVEDMRRFISHAAKVPEPGVNVYKGHLVIDGSSVIAMMNLVGTSITVEYPKNNRPFDSFVKQFLI